MSRMDEIKARSVALLKIIKSMAEEAKSLSSLLSTDIDPKLSKSLMSGIMVLGKATVDFSNIVDDIIEIYPEFSGFLNDKVMKNEVGNIIERVYEAGNTLNDTIKNIENISGIEAKDLGEVHRMLVGYLVELIEIVELLSK